MKANLKVRFKNPWFWVGIIGVILSAMGISVDSLTSWSAVLDAAKAFISNPLMIGSVVIAVLGVFVDPTTSGISDSNLAMTYTSPKKDEEPKESN